ncbi:hypothetical protein BDZ89DRAFT_448545 [Hymenopellis radicata]|nr:hypothetical protein BDZ89DRAFT_448545 [Hymenopellis radicata]
MLPVCRRDSIYSSSDGSCKTRSWLQRGHCVASVNEAVHAGCLCRQHCQRRRLGLTPWLCSHLSGGQNRRMKRRRVIDQSR